MEHPQSSAPSPKLSQARLKSKYSSNSPAVRPLYTITSIDDFKSVFVDLIKTHRAIYELEGSIGSITHSNVMFTNTSQPRAVLVSLDYPLQMPAGNELYTRKRDAPVEHPFLPLDVTSYGAERPFFDHLYRHHLESFFYILLYCSLQYATLPAHLIQTSAVLTNWFYRHGRCGDDLKRVILGQECPQDNILLWASGRALGADPEIQLWLSGLWEIFKNVTQITFNSRKDPVEWATLNDRATFEEFMAILSGRGRVIVSDRSCAPRCAVFMP